MQEFSIDKKWKYLQFLKNENSWHHWSLDFSDERSGIPRDRLLSSDQLSQTAKTGSTFLLVFNAVATDPQLIECSDGLYRAFQIVDGSPMTTWKLFPIFFNQRVWRQLSSYLRFRESHYVPLIDPHAFNWMTKKQLQLTLRLMIESLDITDELAMLTIELLIKDREEE
ncbi:MAG: hypothetical protein EAZ28_07880 [Oscillatoriales cyanobacterium]|nr:MAG: hypothetical protein EAZ28_07880 [Oscillatoriales cyanobacterium]